MNHHHRQSERRASSSGTQETSALVQLSVALKQTFHRCARRAEPVADIQQPPLKPHHYQTKHQYHQQAARPSSAGSTTVAKSSRNGPASSNPEIAHESSSSSSRRILTKKTQLSGNNGLDNEEQNLIVRARDILGGRDATPMQPDFVVLDLLGQGTFGQVFRCQNVETKEIVAIKVIRNHPSYYKQAIVEVQITRLLNASYREEEAPHFVRLKDTFEFRNHLCLVFELLSINVYELIAENNFNGFPLQVTRGFLQQILHALVQMEEIGVIHCDLKPENILLVGQDHLLRDVVYANDPLMDRLVAATRRSDASDPVGGCNSSSARSNGSVKPSTGRLATGQTPHIKVVDFGSACMENETVYSYIQSRFYRSPEVLLGIPYTGAIDLWSLGCIAVEMFLGLPLFPGVSEHDQLRLVEETLGKLPQELLRRGRNVLKFYNVDPQTNQFVLKTPVEYARDTKAEVQISKKYFKYSKLEDMVHAYPQSKHASETQLRGEHARRESFLYFVKGLLCVDPTQRWSARQAMQHPFLTGESFVKQHVELALSTSPSRLSLSHLPVVPLPPMPLLSVVAPIHPHEHQHQHQHHVLSLQHQYPYQHQHQPQEVWSSPSYGARDSLTEYGAESIWGPSGMPPYASHADRVSPSGEYYYAAPPPPPSTQKHHVKVAPSAYVSEVPSTRVYPYDSGYDEDLHHTRLLSGGYDENLAACSPASSYAAPTLLLPCKVTPTLSLSSSCDGYPVVLLSPYESIPQPEYESSPYYAPPPPPPRVVGTGAGRADWHWGDERSPWGPGSPAMTWSQETIPRHHQYSMAELHLDAPPPPPPPQSSSINSSSHRPRRAKRQHTASWDNGDTRELRRHEASYPCRSPPSHAEYSHHHPQQQQPQQYRTSAHQHRPQGSSSGAVSRAPRKPDHKAKVHRKSPSHQHHPPHYRQHHSHSQHPQTYTPAQLRQYQQHLPPLEHPLSYYSPAAAKRDDSTSMATTGVCSVEEKFSSAMNLMVTTSALPLPT